jgi:hypothetical protein
MSDDFLFDDGGWTLAEARRRFVQGLDNPEGVICPCCFRYAKRYKRHLYSTQARDLIALYRLNRRNGWDKFFHRSVVIPHANNNDLAFLRHWGLLEQEPNVDPSKKDSGRFRITTAGRQFVEDAIHVPKFCIQYHDHIEGFSRETVSIREALGHRFDYMELMRE